MEFVITFVLAFVPAIALLTVPRSAVRGTALATGVLVLLLALWTWSFNNSCSSDGCIGVFFLFALTVVVAIFGAIAGLIRWAMISAQDRKAASAENFE